MPEDSLWPGTVNQSSLFLLAIHRLNRSKKDEKSEGQPRPGEDDNDGQQWKAPKPVDGADVQQPQRESQKAVDRMEQQVFPKKGVNGRHDEKGRDDQETGNFGPGKVLVIEPGEQRPTDDAHGQHGTQN